MRRALTITKIRGKDIQTNSQNKKVEKPEYKYVQLKKGKRSKEIETHRGAGKLLQLLDKGIVTEDNTYKF